MDLSQLWSWAGLSFGQEETFILLLSLKKLVDEKPIKSVRLWGKIFGTQQNYLVVEAELKEGAQDEEDALVNPNHANEKPAEELQASPEASGESPKADDDEADAPKPKQAPVKTLSIEQRAGINKYVYYVCHYGKLYFF
jgi:radial spoke head protein 4A